jgi:eukaryotic-like serine/threonine-protein kinase
VLLLAFPVWVRSHTMPSDSNSTDGLAEVAGLFAELIELDPPTRGARLAALADAALRHELEGLLAADAEVNDLLRGIEGLMAPLRLDDAPALAPGTAVGPYRIVGELGRGGMGVVYRAEDTRLGRTVALKFLPTLRGADAGARAQLLTEARSAAALDHPNVGVVHGVEETPNGALFLVLACYNGETLRERLRGGPLPVAEAIDAAQQVAGALDAAHRHGIIHRDVKPSNVLLLTSAPADARVKLLDFGVAHVFDNLPLPADALRGTAAYMAPDQSQGAQPDEQADLWALGVILYEMLAGRRPFGGEGEALLHALCHEAPLPVKSLRPETPPALARLVHRLLEKEPARRPASAREVMAALDDIQDSRERRTRRFTLWSAGLVAALVAGAVVGVPLRQSLRAEQARAAIPEVEALVADWRFADAHARLARAARTLGPDDPEVARIGPLVTDTLVLETTPSGARVTLARYTPGTPEPVWEEAGQTPLRLIVPRADYLVRFEREGHAPAERITPTQGPVRIRHGAVSLHAALDPTGRVPEGMVAVPGGPYRLPGWNVITRTEVTLDPFFIDRHEVTNRAFADFVAAGGYGDPSFWTLPFMEDGGRPLGREAAFARLVDRTGLPGPRGWSDGTYPEGAADLPVTGVTRYEAAAYAAWAGGRLPTVFEWDKAARDGAEAPRGVAMPWGEHFAERDVHGRANFEGTALLPVGSRPFGISPFGAHDMAGNAAEWAVGASGPDGVHHLAVGGSWRDPIYLFGWRGSSGAFHSSDAIGFRVARSLPGSAATPGVPFEPPPPPPVFHPAGDAVFATFLEHYVYDRRPLTVRTAATEEHADWTRLDLRFEGPDGYPYRALLYLPRHARPPYQPIVFGPHGGVFIGIEMDWSTMYILEPHVRAGRAVLAVFPPGATGAPGPPFSGWPDPSSVAFRSLNVRLVTALRLGLDVLLERSDMDPERVAFVAMSAGGWLLIAAAVEPRFQSVVLIGGLLRTYSMESRPEANPVHFAPRITAPVLMVNGRYDENGPLESEVMPLWQLLPEPKRLALVEGGHNPPPESRTPVIQAWLDETLGPVDTVSVSRLRDRR